MEIKLEGCTRVVVLLWGYAFKFPMIKMGHTPFLIGCSNNWKERSCYNYVKKYNSELLDRISPSFFCSWFGLIQIQGRCKPLKRELTDVEKDYFSEFSNNDNKKENFGIYKGKIVCLDYP